eukprot:1019125-Rhodomonas_salina.1
MQRCKGTDAAPCHSRISVPSAGDKDSTARHKKAMLGFRFPHNLAVSHICTAPAVSTAEALTLRACSA